MKYDILITGVGGQGTIFASRLLASAAINSGYNAGTAETIGMAQRGGSVSSHVRLGESVKSPLIPDGKADLLLAFEPGEAVRNLGKLAPAGKCLVNVNPVQSVISAMEGSYQDIDELCSYLQFRVPDVLFVDGKVLAGGAEFSKTLNVILLGVALQAGYLPISRKIMEKTIVQNIPERFRKLNLDALAKGMSFNCIGEGRE